MAKSLADKMSPRARARAAEKAAELIREDLARQAEMEQRRKTKRRRRAAGPLTLSIESTADYFVILCASCRVETENRYRGGDPVVPHFRAICPQCKRSKEWKLSNWTGLRLRVRGSRSLKPTKTRTAPDWWPKP